MIEFGVVGTRFIGYQWPIDKSGVPFRIEGNPMNRVRTILGNQSSHHLLGAAGPR